MDINIETGQIKAKIIGAIIFIVLLAFSWAFVRDTLLPIPKDASGISHPQPEELEPYRMPTFPSSETQFEKELVKRNTARVESLGYEVIRIPTEADSIHGGIHCLANVVE